MKRNRAYWGDWVQVSDQNGEPAGEGVVQGCPSGTGQDNEYYVNPTYGDGWSKSGEHMSHVPEEQVTLVEEGWSQKWYKRVFRK